jgi:regulation of enolase protein 1 (concanavalin A-like superfamily)
MLARQRRPAYPAAVTTLAGWKGLKGTAGTLTWQHAPSRWSLLGEAEVLRVEPDAHTDYWQRTHYGFVADNGHFAYADVAGDWVMATHVRFHPVHQYDQAGLMVRWSPSCWLKTSVEYEPGGPGRLGAVVTNHAYSDWSTQPFDGDEVWLRVRREGSDYIVESSLDGRHWEQLRMAHLAEDDGQRRVACGLYACSPKGAGFAAEFSELRIEPGRR